MLNDCTKVPLKGHLTCKWTFVIDTLHLANKKIRVYFCCGKETELSAALPSVIKLNRRHTKAHANGHSRSIAKALCPCKETALLSSACYHWIRRMHDYHGYVDQRRCLPIQAGYEEWYKSRSVVPGHKTQVTLANTRRQLCPTGPIKHSDEARVLFLAVHVKLTNLLGLHDD